MKRILIILLLICAAIVICFIPITENHDIVIKNNFDNALSSLSAPGNWRKWNSAVKNLDGTQYRVLTDPSHHYYKFSDNKDSFVIKAANPLLYEVQEYEKGEFSYYALEILPSFSASNSITVRAIERTSLLFYLLPFFDSDHGKSAANDLKNYLEDAKAFYGYDIKVEKVTDTVFATEMIRIPRTELFRILPAEFKDIKSFIKEHGLVQTNSSSVSYLSKGDSIELILGIPVNKFVKTSSKIYCVNIPKGKMLTAIYEGRFGNRQDIYQAFKKYTRDNLMENVGATFESYINDQLPSSDSSVVKFKLYYPIL